LTVKLSLKNNKNTHFTKYTKQWITLKPGKYHDSVKSSNLAGLLFISRVIF
jgi:hypothetical protein